MGDRLTPTRSEAQTLFTASMTCSRSFLLGGVDARCPGVTLALFGDLRGLGNDQSGRSTLGVIAGTEGG